MSIRWVRQTLTAVLLLAGGALFLGEFFAVPADRDQARVAPLPPPTFPVVRAAKPIARGTVIRTDDIDLSPSAVVPEASAMTSVEEAVDRIAIRDIAGSEPLSRTNTAAAIEGTSLSEVIPPGLRAVALHVSEDSSVANLIKPGDRVDVLVVSNTARASTATGRVFPPAQAVTILQNIPVLAVGSVSVVAASNTSTAPARTVALAVTPRQAAMVALVRTVGTEYLSLRASGDDVEVATSTVSTEDLHPNQPVASRPAPAAAPATVQRPRVRTLEIISGKSDNVSRLSLADGK